MEANADPEIRSQLVSGLLNFIHTDRNHSLLYINECKRPTAIILNFLIKFLNNTRSTSSNSIIQIVWTQETRR